MDQLSPWLTAAQAGEHAQCSVKSIYRAVQEKRLRAARISDRRNLRFLREWLDAWLVASATPFETTETELRAAQARCAQLEAEHERLRAALESIRGHCICGAALTSSQEFEAEPRRVRER